MGYTPDLVSVVWFGEDTPKRMVYQGVRYGSWNAATIWGNFMREALKNKPITDFPKPSGLVEGVLIDTKTGLLVPDDCTLPPEETRREIFIAGTEPPKFHHDVHDPGGKISRSYSDKRKRNASLFCF